MKHDVVATSSKTLEEHFADWEVEFFGYGYGSGEPVIMPLLRRFLELTSPTDGYDHRVLERELTPAVAWLLINVLLQAGVFDYGTSSRHGFLTPRGRRLRDFVLSRPAEDLVWLTACQPDDYVHCSPDACNCGPHGYETRRLCPNPFWRD